MHEGERKATAPWGRWRLIAHGASVWIQCVLILLPCLRAPAQAAGIRNDSASLAALLDRMKTNMPRNGVLSQQYTSVELWHNVNFDKSGKKTLDESAKFENVFVEGLPYRKKVEENGKPLTGKTAEEEQRRYDKAISERKKMSMEEKRRGLHLTFTFSWPLCCLTTLYDNRVVGHETISGRETIVIESTPKPDARPASEMEKSALNWRETTWIDVADAMPAQIEVESLKDVGHMAKGMTTRAEFERMVDTAGSATELERAVWLQRSVVSRFQFKLLWIGLSGETDQTWSDFRRFHVDMRLLEDTVEEAPQGTAQR
jgi:hypothetical protein